MLALTTEKAGFCNGRGSAILYTYQVEAKKNMKSNKINIIIYH